MIMNIIVQNFSHDWQQKWSQKSLCCFWTMLNNKDGVIHTVHTAVAGGTKILSGADRHLLSSADEKYFSRNPQTETSTTFTEWKKAGRSLVWRKQCSVRLQVVSPILVVGIVGKPWQELLGFLMQKDTSSSQGRRTQWKIFQKSIWAQASLTENENAVI